MKDKHTTDVLFLIEKPEGNLPCDVFAYFPNEKYFGEMDEKSAERYGADLRMRTSYAHVGQHSACHPDYAAECTEATDYEDLKKELEGIGYSLNVLNK